MNCEKCKIKCVKNGFQTNGKQRFKCKKCHKNYQKTYSYNACNFSINTMLVKLVTNGCSISGMSRILNINKKTVTTRIIQLANKVKLPIYTESNKEYEIDEMFTKVSGASVWLTYAINKQTREVISFVVGDRKNTTLVKIVNKVLALSPLKIHTDKLPGYLSLIPKSIHSRKRYNTNRIERQNLNLRTHLKVFNRKTLCYAKSTIYLNAVLKLYWFHPCHFGHRAESRCFSYF